MGVLKLFFFLFYASMIYVKWEFYNKYNMAGQVIIKCVQHLNNKGV